MASGPGERGVEVHGGVDHSVVVTGDHNVFHYLVEGIRALPTDYAGCIENFLAEYLSTPEHPVPFGGREQDLRNLDRWLDDPTQAPYLLLAAPGGRGKSALLAHWAGRLVLRPDMAVVFVPVSVRFSTAAEVVVFSAAVARLAAVHDEKKVPGDANTPAGVWRGLLSDYLRRPLPRGRRLLLVLDGLDEAVGWQPGADLFPLRPPAGLRVVVSARPLAGDSGAAGWLRRLGWGRLGLAYAYALGPLDRSGVADVLVHMGCPLADLGANGDLVATLHGLSGGDPLLVRLYVEDLWARGEEAARLRPEGLRAIRPGLEGYFEKWWHDQENLWGEQRPLREPQVRQLLQLLAFALGPLSQRDIRRLVPDAGLDGPLLDELMRPLRRLVVGDGRGQGFALTHPQLATHFAARWEDDRHGIEARFLDWGKDTLGALVDGRLASRNASQYLVEHYGAHLGRSGAGPEKLLGLVSEAWLRAWEAVEGSYSGFLTDVDRAWDAARRADREEAQAGRPALNLGGEMRCALCQSSVNSLAGNIPPELLRAAVRHEGGWSPAQVLAYARQTPRAEQRARALAAIMAHLPADQQVTAGCAALEAACAIGYEVDQAVALVALAPVLPETLLPQALQAARAMCHEQARSAALAALAPVLPETLLPQALEAARAIGDVRARSAALAALAPVLPGALLPQVLEATHAIGDEWSQSAVLAALAPVLPGALLPQALDAARAVGYEWARSGALAALAPVLPEAHLPQVLEAARVMGDGGARSQVLAAVAPRLPEPLRAGAWAEAWAGACAIGYEGDRALALAALAPALPEALLPQVLEAARVMGDGGARSQALAAVAPRLPKPLRAAAWADALAAAHNGDVRARADLLAVLAPALPEALLPQALESARAIGDVRARSQALAALAARLPEPLRAGACADALAAARGIGYEEDRAQALAALAPALPEALLPQALEAARAIADVQARSAALAALASELPPPLVPRALDVARAIGDGEYRSRALAALAPMLPQPQRAGAWADALVAARAIEDVRARSQALAALAPVLPEPQRAGAWADALTAACAIGYEWARSRALAALAPVLPEALLPQALRTAAAMGDEGARSAALAALASVLPEPLRAGAWADALAAARSADVRARADLLAALAPALPEALLPQALEAGRAIGYEGPRSAALAALAPVLPEALLPQALEAARAIGGEGPRSTALAALAPRLPEPQRTAAWAAALEAARAIGYEEDRSAALAALAPALPEPLLPQALEAGCTMRYEWARADALAALAPVLPEPLLPQALETARAIREGDYRSRALAALAARLPEPLRAGAWADALAPAGSGDSRARADLLAALAPVLPEPLLPQALEAARAIGDEWARSAALAALAPVLPEPLLPQALEAARAIGMGEHRAPVLAALASRLHASLQGPVWAEATAAATGIEHGMARAKALADLVPSLVTLEARVLYPLWEQALPRLAAPTRPDLLDDIRALVPVLVRLGASEAAADTFHAIQDVGRWWP
jgi:hypothetical protein